MKFSFSPLRTIATLSPGECALELESLEDNCKTKTICTKTIYRKQRKITIINYHHRKTWFIVKANTHILFHNAVVINYIWMRR